MKINYLVRMSLFISLSCVCTGVSLAQDSQTPPPREVGVSEEEYKKATARPEQTKTPPSAATSFCKDLCGDDVCQEIVCQAEGCPCSESSSSCPQDCP